MASSFVVVKNQGLPHVLIRRTRLVDDVGTLMEPDEDKPSKYRQVIVLIPTFEEETRTTGSERSQSWNA